MVKHRVQNAKVPRMLYPSTTLTPTAAKLFATLRSTSSLSDWLARVSSSANTMNDHSLMSDGELLLLLSTLASVIHPIPSCLTAAACETLLRCCILPIEFFESFGPVSPVSLHSSLTL